MVLPSPYIRAMDLNGTDGAYGATTRDSAGGTNPRAFSLWSSARYAIYARSTKRLVLSKVPAVFLSRSTKSGVRIEDMVLGDWYKVRGTESGYGATRRPGTSSGLKGPSERACGIRRSEVRYQPTRVLYDVRFWRCVWGNILSGTDVAYAGTNCGTEVRHVAPSTVSYASAV
eukprot:3882010-Rhodomonas_salina.4